MRRMTVERYIKFQNRRVKKKIITLAYFHSLPNSKNSDVVARCDKAELITALNMLTPKKASHIDKDMIRIHSDEVYEKLLVYAVVRQTIRKPEKAIDLRSVIKELGLYETHFWASTFAETYRMTLNRRALYRPAKAFKILYGLTER